MDVEFGEIDVQNPDEVEARVDAFVQELSKYEQLSRVIHCERQNDKTIMIKFEGGNEEYWDVVETAQVFHLCETILVWGRHIKRLMMTLNVPLSATLKEKFDILCDFTLKRLRRYEHIFYCFDNDTFIEWSEFKTLVDLGRSTLVFYMNKYEKSKLKNQDS